MAGSRQDASGTSSGMGIRGRLVRNWVIFGMTCGILGDVAYFLAAAPLGLPPVLVLSLGFAFGPLLSLSFLGLYRFFQLHKQTIAIQASCLFGVIAGTIVNMMLVVQSATRLAVPSEAREALGLAWEGLDRVQLGLDVSWDIYLSAATILLGVAMTSHPRFGRTWGAITIAVGAALLILNMLTFPEPPASAGSIDLGPLTGIWYLFIAVRVLTSLRWVEQRLADPQLTDLAAA